METVLHVQSYFHLLKQNTFFKKVKSFIVTFCKISSHLWVTCPLFVILIKNIFNPIPIFLFCSFKALLPAGLYHNIPLTYKFQPSSTMCWCKLWPMHVDFMILNSDLFVVLWAEEQLISTTVLCFQLKIFPCLIS